ncbi:MAG: hypothetical protein L0177_03750 [Chloroflexi bacterium]|nr:hypothetical protein [Chloroflexota bacterium]
MAFEVGPAYGRREGKRLILGVEVFRAGEQTDSAGRTRTWSVEELDAMARAFDAGVPGDVPVKLGHSSEGFNARVASALSLPAEALTGEEPGGDGAARLGEVVKLERKDDKLLADLAVVEQLVSLIRQGFFTDVSSEILTDYQGHEAVLSGVALLGAERPAVKELAGLEAADMMERGRERLVYAFSLGFVESVRQAHDEQGRQAHDAQEAKVEDFAQQVIQRLGARFRVETPDEALALIEKIVEALGQLVKIIAVEDPDSPEAIEGEQGSIAPEEMAAKLAERLDAEKRSSFREGRKSGSQDAETRFHEELSRRDERIAALEREGRISRFRELVRPLLVEGTPDELAEKLADVEARAGEDLAGELLAAWRRESDAVLRFTTSIGTSRPGAPSAGGAEFEEVVARFRESHPEATQAKAYEEVMRSHPGLYREYAESRKLAVNGAKE